MPKLVYSVLCKDAIVDEESNEISLIRIIDGFAVAQVANKPMPENKWVWSLISGRFVTLFVHTANGPDKLSIKAEFIHESGEVFQPPMNADADFSDGSNCRIIVILKRIPFFTKGGTHYVVTKIGSGDEWEEVARTPFVVNIEAPVTDSIAS